MQLYAHVFNSVSCAFALLDGNLAMLWGSNALHRLQCLSMCRARQHVVALGLWRELPYHGI